MKSKRGGRGKVLAALLLSGSILAGDTYVALSGDLIQDQVNALPETQSEEARSASTENPLQGAYERYVLPREAMGETWGLAYEDLSTGKICSFSGNKKLQSASVIKVFIMGTVYERICEPKTKEEAIPYRESYEGEFDDLLEQMITVSSNEAANRLIEILGEGDVVAGESAVNDFCEEHGYKNTHLGRVFLASNPTDDNYTSAMDCRKILSEIYHKTLVSEEASEKMLELLKGQTLRYKIPAVLPSGYSAANKTGEMPEGYGLGCIENDIAIIFSPEGQDYILAVLSNDLAGRNSEAQQVIQQISEEVISDR